MIVKLLAENYSEFLSLTGGCRGLTESTIVKMSNCWKSHVLAQIWLSHSSDEAKIIEILLYYLHN